MSFSPALAFVSCPVPPQALNRSPGGQPLEQRRMAYLDWPAADPACSGHVVVCVHGLSRQGRDFDTLAQALQPTARVICPDVAGRGQSDWLADPMTYQVATYVGDMVALLAQLRSEGVHTVDWVGSSMGGLIGMALAAQPALGLRRLVLNDVGPAIQPEALLRIGTYLGTDPRFASAQEAADYLWRISSAFGPHTPAQWLALSLPMLVPQGVAAGASASGGRGNEGEGGGFRLHYDPAIAVPFRALTADLASTAAQQGEAMLWQMYDHITTPTLVLRGGDSDLLLPSTAAAMAQRGPKARVVEFAGVGHAPTLVALDQIDVVRQFLGEPA
jgi:pimeloyl-ACP methyl ester carboxylesterase